MNSREHALLARTLIEACGKVDEAVAACKRAGWRIAKSQMSNYQNPNHKASMPGEVIDILELYCGKPLYSRAMLEQHLLEQDDIECLVEEASDAAEHTVEFQSAARKAAKDGKYTQTEVDILARKYRKALEGLRDAGAALQRCSTD